MEYLWDGWDFRVIKVSDHFQSRVFVTLGCVHHVEDGKNDVLLTNVRSSNMGF